MDEMQISLHVADPHTPQYSANNEEWNNWWTQNDTQSSSTSMENIAGTIAELNNNHHPEPIAYATAYGEDWFAEQLANIPMLVGNGYSGSEIIQVNPSAADGTGYVLVADRELAAILGGHVDKDTIYWLLANFKLERNAVMPRGFLYSKYEAFCAAHGKPLMNQACMGKTVRALFRGLETRRLGRRGKSRYHYIGLAIHPEGEFAGMVPLEPEEIATESAEGERKRRRTTLASKKMQENPVGKQFENLNPDNRLEAALDQLDKMLCVRRNRHILPYRLRLDEALSSQLPFDDNSLPEGLTKNDVIYLLKDFRIHLGLLGHTIVSGVVTAIPSILENFWINQSPSLQLAENFDRLKFNLALQWKPFLELIGFSYVELYGAVIEQIVPKQEKALSTQVLDLFYEFATKYCQWVKAITAKVNHEVHLMMNAAAVSFTQCLKQLIVLNSALGLVDLVERDRSKAAIIADGFRALSDRFCLICNLTNSEEQLILAVQNLIVMEFISSNDFTLQRWRGWVRNVIDLKMDIIEGCALKTTKEQMVAMKEEGIAELRFIWMGVMTEMQKNVERCGKDYSTPMTFILSYFMHSVNFALDNAQAKLHDKTLLQYGYQIAKVSLAETDYLATTATPNYDMAFFTNRLVANVDIDVFDFHYFGSFDELRGLVHSPNFNSLSRLDDSLDNSMSSVFDEDKRAADELMDLEQGADTFHFDEFVRSLGCEESDALGDRITHHYGIEQTDHEILAAFMRPGF